MSNPRVLVIRGGAIGDFILTLPAIQLIRESIPHVEIEILGYEKIISLAKVTGFAEQTRHLEHQSMARLFIPNAPLDAELEAYFKSFNLVVSYLYDPDLILKNNFEKLGVKTYLAGNPKLSSEPGSSSAAHQLAQPLEKLAFFLDRPYVDLNFAEPAQESPQKPQILLHPGSGSLLKNWPALRWIEAGKRLTTTFPDHEIVAILGEAEIDRGIAEHLQLAWKGLPIQFWENLSLIELGQRMSLAKVFLGHDSGIAHLAAACGLPGLQLFGPTSPQVWAPRNPKFQALTAPSGNLSDFELDSTIQAMIDFVASV